MISKIEVVNPTLISKAAHLCHALLRQGFTERVSLTGATRQLMMNPKFMSTFFGVMIRRTDQMGHVLVKLTNGDQVSEILNILGASKLVDGT